MASALEVKGLEEPHNAEDKDECPKHAEFNYISRNHQKFDDDNSNCENDPPSEDEESMNKTSATYLLKQKSKIEK